MSQIPSILSVAQSITVQLQPVEFLTQGLQDFNQPALYERNQRQDLCPYSGEYRNAQRTNIVSRQRFAKIILSEGEGLRYESMCCYQNQSHRRATWRLTTAWCGATLLMLILALMLFDQIKEIEFGKVWTVGIQFPESGKILWGHWVECRSPARKSVISRPVYLDCNIEDCHLRTLFLTSTMHCFIYYSMSRDLRPSQSTNSKDIK